MTKRTKYLALGIIAILVGITALFLTAGFYASAQQFMAQTNGIDFQMRALVDPAAARLRTEVNNSGDRLTLILGAGLTIGIGGIAGGIALLVRQSRMDQ